jgi:hypothetical protein
MLSENELATILTKGQAALIDWLGALSLPLDNDARAFLNQEKARLAALAKTFERRIEAEHAQRPPDLFSFAAQQQQQEGGPC